MEFGKTQVGYRIDSHGDFLNVGSLWAMFTAMSSTSPDDLASWANRVSDGLAELDSWSTVSPTARARAFASAVEHFTQPLFVPPKSPLFSRETSVRRRDWQGFSRSYFREELESVRSWADVAVTAETGRGSLSHDYPWRMSVSYFRSSGAERISADAWFTDEPSALLFRFFFESMEAQLRDALASAAEDTELGRHLRRLALF